MLRFAPSPTGDMHIGNLRVALFNHIVASQRGEELALHTLTLFTRARTCVTTV
jgi:hypothetical protein